MLQFEMRQVHLLFSAAPLWTYTVYRQGATGSADAVFSSPSTVRVSVYDVGRIVAGDSLKWDQAPTVLFSVIAVDPNRKWLDLQTTSFPVTVRGGDRLFPSLAPTLYSDPLGANALASNAVTLDSQGRGFFYYGGSVYDAVLMGSGTTEHLYDQPAGVDVRSAGEVNVLDYPSFQLAHDALPDSGGKIWVPPGTYTKDTVPAFTGLVVTKPVAIIGVSNGQSSALSVLEHDGNDNDTDSIFLGIAGGCLIKDILIRRSFSQRGKGRGIRWYKSGDAGKMVGLTLDNVTVWRSPNWSFEFLCDGLDANYVSKLVMVDCSAYEAASGGSLHLGGAGSNNNYFSRCEFNGPGEGYYFSVNACVVNASGTTVTAPTGSFSGVAAGDEVFGMGIAVGTTVAPVPPPTASQITLSMAAIETPLGGPTTLNFWRSVKPSDSLHPLPRGHVHIVRTSASRFHQCTFQGPGIQPALSTDLISNYLVLRDCYREAGGTGGDAAHSFVINGMTNLLIDGLYHQFHGYPSLLLRTGPSGLWMSRIANVQMLSGDPTNGNVISLARGTDELIVDNVFEYHVVTGVRRDIAALSTGIARPPLVARRGGRVSLPQLQAEIRPGTPGPIDVRGCTYANTGTVARPATGTSSYLDRCERIQVTSATALVASASLASGQRLVYRGAAGGRGGFYLCARFSVSPQGIDNRAFVGLANGLSDILPGQTPDALLNVVGVAWMASWQNWKLLWNDSAGSASTSDLGGGFPFGAGTYELELWAEPSGAVINYRVTRLDGASASPAAGVLDTNLPAAGTSLAMRAEINTGASNNAAVVLNVLNLYAEQDFP